MNGEPGNVVYRWTPRKPESFEEREDTASEYAVEAEPKAISGIMLWARWGDRWEANPWSARPILRHLLDERTELLNALNGILDNDGSRGCFDALKSRQFHDAAERAICKATAEVER